MTYIDCFRSLLLEDRLEKLQNCGGRRLKETSKNRIQGYFKQCSRIDPIFKVREHCFLFVNGLRSEKETWLKN